MLPDIGGSGQVALVQKHIVIVGLGGIGSPALQYLAAAGIGRFTLIDHDIVDETNLQRQTIFTKRDVGHGKATSARRWLSNFDDVLEVQISDSKMTKGSSTELIENADLVLDGTDNFATRLAVSDHCVAAKVPLLSAAVGRFQGQVGAFAGHLKGQPCYRCFVGDAFDSDDCDTCAQDGMLGAMAGWVGTFGAMQCIRILLEGVSSFGDPQYGTLHILDGLSSAIRALRIPKDPECRGCN